MAQGLSTPDRSLNPTHLSIRRGRATTTHYTHHQVILMVSRNTTLVPSLRLRIGPACEAGFSAGRRIRKKEKESGRLSWLPVSFLLHVKYTLSYRIVNYLLTYPMIQPACDRQMDGRTDGLTDGTPYGIVAL